jgi:hypothetical protein
MFQAEQFRTIVTDLRIRVSFATILPFGPPKTADILGAFKQLAETAILLMAASLFHSGLQL